MNEAISWHETGLSEVLVTKLDCFCYRQRFRLGINSFLTEIMVERSTGAEIIPSSVIPCFVPA